MEQTPRRGRRLSILGLWQPDETFEYALAIGSFKGESYIKVMDWLADSCCDPGAEGKTDGDCPR
jgi:putative transposase